MTPALLTPTPGCCRFGIIHRSFSSHTIIVSPSYKLDQYFITYYRSHSVLRTVSGSRHPLIAQDLPDVLSVLTEVTGWETAKWKTQPYKGPIDRNIWLMEGAHVLFDHVSKAEANRSVVVH